MKIKTVHLIGLQMNFLNILKLSNPLEVDIVLLHHIREFVLKSDSKIKKIFEKYPPRF